MNTILYCTYFYTNLDKRIAVRQVCNSGARVTRLKIAHRDVIHTAGAVSPIANPRRAVTNKPPRVVDVAMATEHRFL